MIFPIVHPLSPVAFRLHWWNVQCRELGAIPCTSVRRCFRAGISLVRNIFNGSTRVAVNDFHSIRKAHASIWIIIVCVVRTKFFMEKGFEWGKSILENLWCGLLANFSLHLLVHLVSRQVCLFPFGRWSLLTVTVPLVWDTRGRSTSPFHPSPFVDILIP